MVVQRTRESPKTFSRPQESRREWSAVASSPLLATASVVLETPRPNPQSQSLSRGYGSILPTSLIYIVLSTRGCTPWRPEAVMSTTRGAKTHSIGVSRAVKCAPDNQKSAAFPDYTPYRRSIRFHGLFTVKKKRELFPGHLPAFPISLCYHLHPRPSTGILTCFPFDIRTNQRKVTFKQCSPIS